MKDLIHIGKIVAPHGINGQVILEHALGKPISFKGIDALFIENTKGSFIPYFIQAASAKTDTISHIHFEGLRNREATQILVSKKAWLPQAAFQTLVEKQAPIALLGFMIQENGQNLGTIKEVIEQAHQLLVTISYHGQDAYIPLHQDSLLGIDHAKKIIKVQLPEGLLDLYTESQL